MIAKARRVMREVWGMFRPPRIIDGRDLQHHAEKLADNMAHCSGPCCSHRRELEGPPFSEVRQTLAEKEDCEECGADWNESCAPWCPSKRIIRHEQA